MRHRIFVWAWVLGGFLLGSVGYLPSPILVARFFGGAPAERFPCEADACGCITARECWTQCCCFSPTERLAWAAWAGVEPSGYVSLAEVCAETRKSCCDSTEAQVIEDSGGGERVSSVSPLRGVHTRFQCKNISLWLVLSVPVAPVSGDLVILPALVFREFALCETPACRPAFLARDVPTPPPQSLSLIA